MMTAQVAVGFDILSLKIVKSNELLKLSENLKSC